MNTPKMLRIGSAFILLTFLAISSAEPPAKLASDKASQYPNVTIDKDGTKHPATGYDWLNPDADGDYRVVPLRGSRPPTKARPHGTASYTIDIEVEFSSTITQGKDRVMVELRQGSPGSSSVFDTKHFEGRTATLSFSNMPAGSYFVAVGNGDSVAVGPVRQFSDGQAVRTRMRVTSSSGNVSTRSRSGL